MQKYIHPVRATWIQHSIIKEKQSTPRQYTADARLFEVILGLEPDEHPFIRQVRVPDRKTGRARPRNS